MKSKSFTVLRSILAVSTALLGMLEPTVSDDQVIMVLDDPKKSEALMRLAAATVTATAKPIAVSQTQNNLKRFCLAMHN